MEPCWNRRSGFDSGSASLGEAVQDWYIVASANFLPSARSLEDGLAVLEQLLRPVRRLLAGKRVRLGLAQPWGERAARFPEQPIPLLLADWIARADTGITTIDLEVIFGCEPRGTWLRPPLSIQLLLERFAEVPLELEISLGLPAATQTDPLADPPDQNIFEPASESWQAAWAGTLLDLDWHNRKCSESPGWMPAIPHPIWCRTAVCSMLMGNRDRCWRSFAGAELA
jgi:hypothetical protein